MFYVYHIFKQTHMQMSKPSVVSIEGWGLPFRDLDHYEPPRDKKQTKTGWWFGTSIGFHVFSSLSVGAVIYVDFIRFQHISTT